jgi:hypothetical protein
MFPRKTEEKIRYARHYKRIMAAQRFRQEGWAVFPVLNPSWQPGSRLCVLILLSGSQPRREVIK